MNDLCYEIGYRSVNHDGEQLCGDHIEVVEANDNSSRCKSQYFVHAYVKNHFYAYFRGTQHRGMRQDDCYDVARVLGTWCSVFHIFHSAL